MRISRFGMSDTVGINMVKGLAFVGVTTLLLKSLVNGFYQLVKAKEKDYEHLFRDNPQPIWIYDLQTLKFLLVNQSALRTYGYTAAEFLKPP